MFYTVSKIGWFFLEPSNLLVLPLAAGVLALLLARRRLGGALAGLALLGLAVGGWSPLANWIMAPLEERFPAVTLEQLAAREDLAGVVVLGGAVMERPSLAHGQLMLNDAGERVMATVALARALPHLPVVFSGGAGFLSRQEKVEAELVAEHLPALGLAPGRLTLERASVNTWENALFTRPLLPPKPGRPIVLVTSAFHMPRSVGIFRQVGYEVVPYPVDFRTGRGGDRGLPFDRVADGLRRLDLASKEWVGMLVYRATGRMNALFPAP